LDQLTNSFFSNDFPGLAVTPILQSDLLSTNLPVLEVELNIDTKSLIELAKKILLDEVSRTSYMYEETPRMDKWSMQTLWSDGTVVPWIKDIYYKTLSDAVPKKIATDEAKEIQHKLNEFNITAKVCWLSKFQPGGYLRPHRDIGLNLKPLGYFWIPLNNPAGSELKIYPLGTVNVSLGNMYLLNQENYIHGIINQSSQDRYALVGHLSNEISPYLHGSIQQAFQKIYN